MHKKLSTIVVAGTLGIMMTAAGVCLAAEEEKPTANLNVGVYSQYVSRGWAYSKDSIVIQPSFTIGYKGFAFNTWGNLDTNQYIPGGGDDTNNFTEADYTLSYDGSRGKLNYGVGYTYYGYDALEDTQEIYGKLGLAVLLNPTLTVYRDFDHFPGWYFSLGVSHSCPLPREISLDLAASLSYMSMDNAKSMADPHDPNEAYNAFHSGVISAGLTIPVNKYLKVIPSIAWSFALSNESSDRLEIDNRAVIGENEDNFVYGGVALGVSF